MRIPPRCRPRVFHNHTAFRVRSIGSRRSISPTTAVSVQLVVRQMLPGYLCKARQAKLAPLAIQAAPSLTDRLRLSHNKRRIFP